jgi:predicted GNAT family acetyltransferase
MRIRELIQRDITNRKGFEQKKQIGNLTYVAHSKGNRDLSILVYDGENQIANALFRIHFDGDSLASDDTYVQKEYRKLGIANNMYNWAQELGNTIVPSHTLSRMGKAFWKHRKANPTA